jgi:hypothetical protein
VAVSVVIAVLALLTTILVHVTPQESQHRAACIKAVLEHHRMMAVIKHDARTPGLTTVPTMVIVGSPRSGIRPPQTADRRIGGRPAAG